MQNELIGIDTAEEQRLGLEIAQNAVEGRIPKAADPIFVDLYVFRQLRQFVHYCGRPAILVQKVRSIARQRSADADAVSVRIENVERRRRQVLAVGPVAPIEPN